MGLCPEVSHKRMPKRAAVDPWLSGIILLVSVVSVFCDSPIHPSLALIESALLTTAKLDFNSDWEAYQAAAQWDRERLRDGKDSRRAPHLACAQYDHGRKAASYLHEILLPGSMRHVSHSSKHGVCFLATSSYSEAEAVLADPAQFGLVNFGPFPSTLKISPGLLEHIKGCDDSGNTSGRLTTIYGSLMRKINAGGLNLELSPGILPPHTTKANTFIGDLLGDLMSESLDLHASNVWSDPAMVGGKHLSNPRGALRGREWSRAAAVVHKLSLERRTSPGDVCSWDSVTAHHIAGDMLLVSGVLGSCCWVKVYFYVLV